MRSAAALIHVFGYEGRQAVVYCPHIQGYEDYEKYLCKNECGNDDDVLIKTTETNKHKYSTEDDGKGLFTATISDLSLTDAGKYWCGVTRTGKDIYSEVQLDVVEGKAKKGLNLSVILYSTTCPDLVLYYRVSP